MKTLEWFREIGPLTKTRYQGLYLWRQDRGIWRHVVAVDASDAWETGPPYRTKGEAFTALPETAERFELLAG